MKTAPAPSLSKKILKVISHVKAVKPSRLRTSADLTKDFGFDNLDVVSIIWELEKIFNINIPDEVPLRTVGDFVEYVSNQTKQRGQV